MACQHRYRVEHVDGKGAITCRLCGDVRIDGLPLDADQEAIQDRIAWEARLKRAGLWIPPT